MIPNTQLSWSTLETNSHSQEEEQQQHIMSTSATTSRCYIAVHDDARHLSTNEHTFRRTHRSDGREPSQHRPVQLQLTRRQNSATVTVRMGSIATAHVTGHLVPPPNSDRPNEGGTRLSVELSPMASTRYRAAAPLTTGDSGSSTLASMDRTQRWRTNPILRAVERCWDAALDAEALCVLPGQLVWKLTGVITVLQDDGNCLDAAVMASIAALRHYRQPVVDTNTRTIQTTKDPIPLPLHVTPLSMTFAVLPGSTTASDGALQFWVDPTAKEELCSLATLSLALTMHGQLCWWTFAGEEIQLPQMRHCHDTAAALLPELSQHLQQALERADEQAMKARTEQMENTNSSAPPPNVPYLVEAPEAPVDIPMPTLEEKEEDYRKRALDYNQGHITAKVREAAPPRRSGNNTKLLTALLQSVAAATDATRSDADGGNDNDDGATGTTENTMRDTSSEALPTLGREKSDELKVAASQQETANPTVTSTTASLSSQPNAPSQPVTTGVIDSDNEEEVPMQLQSEFAAAGPNDKSDENKEGELDLTAAIKKGKKAKKKKSKR